MLLVGAGEGEATCGILYLASYLRRGGIEAFVQLMDSEPDEAALIRSLHRLLRHLKPRLVGISLKWFHHVARALVVARAIREVDPSITIAFGGNSASFWWRDLVALDCVDVVVLGDGEVPLLALAQGHPAPPNVVTRKHLASASRATLDYVQGAKSDDLHYSHFDQIFLSQQDLHSFSGWVAPGKGCGENCLYCGGTRGMQKATFGRAKPFLRPVESVQRDHREIVPRTWQLRYDFAGSTAAFLQEAWSGVDLSGHATTYFLWGIPKPELVRALASAFQRVHLVIDIGCFSQTQRTEQLSRGLLKPCPTDAELLEVIDSARRHSNLLLEISGIAGLPFASLQTLSEERALVKRVLGLGCGIGYQRLESQPGALATEHPERFGMHSEAKDFSSFLEFFEARDPSQRNVPMIRYVDPALEAAVQDTVDELDALIWKQAEKRDRVRVNAKTKLTSARTHVQRLDLGAWLGAHRAPARLAHEAVTVVRAPEGTGLACAPSLGKPLPEDPSLVVGPDAADLLAALESFAAPTPMNEGLRAVSRSAGLAPVQAEALIGQLVENRLLTPK